MGIKIMNVVSLQGMDIDSHEPEENTQPKEDNLAPVSAITGMVNSVSQMQTSQTALQLHTIPLSQFMSQPITGTNNIPYLPTMPGSAQTLTFVTPQQIVGNRMQISPQQSMQIPQQQRVQLPPRQRMQLPPQQRMQIPPQQRLQLPPQQRMQLPPQQRMQIPPQQPLQTSTGVNQQRMEMPSRQQPKEANVAQPSSNVVQNQNTQKPLNTPAKNTNELKFATTYKCEKCCVHAPVLSAMVEHLRVSHTEISKLFLCPYCRKYEGATEPDIHKHIKLFHKPTDQKSPPVALSGPAKKHLRTIQVPVSADAKKIGQKYSVEKDIYKCLKCHKHMPSLDFIYDHLEKTHNEVFVYICPYCKKFKDKKEEVVFNHIKIDHNKSPDDIMLSLAIEENLFTRIQSLVKDKQPRKNQSIKQQPVATEKSTNQNASETFNKDSERAQALRMRRDAHIKATKDMQMQELKEPPKELQAPMVTQPMQDKHHVQVPFRSQLETSHESQQMSAQRSHSALPQYSNVNIPSSQQSITDAHRREKHSNSLASSIQRLTELTNSPSSSPRLQSPTPSQQGVPSHPAQLSQSKASRRKSQPHHIVPHTVQSGNEDDRPNNSTQEQRLHSPPPLMRAPPPLLHIPPEAQARGLAGSPDDPSMYQQFNITNKQPNSASISSPLGSAKDDSIYQRNLPVLRIPSVPSNFSRPSSANSGRSSGDDRPSRTDTGTPLDLSRNNSEDDENDMDRNDDDLPPESFQIFNLSRPANRQPNMMQRMGRIGSPPPDVRSLGSPSLMAMQQMTAHPNQPPNYHRPVMNRPPPPYNSQMERARIMQQVARQRYNSRTPQAGNMFRRGGPMQGIRGQRPMLQRPGIPNRPGVPNRQNNFNMNQIPMQRNYKCPYCPHVVPLSQREVQPHIHQVHPGHTVTFMKITQE